MMAGMKSSDRAPDDNWADEPSDDVANGEATFWVSSQFQINEAPGASHSWVCS